MYICIDNIYIYIYRDIPRLGTSVCTIHIHVYTHGHLHAHAFYEGFRFCELLLALGVALALQLLRLCGAPAPFLAVVHPELVAHEEGVGVLRDLHLAPHLLALVLDHFLRLLQGLLARVEVAQAQACGLQDLRPKRQYILYAWRQVRRAQALLFKMPHV